MTKAQFYKLLNKPDSKCDGYEIHLKRCWENNRAKSIFSMTGLDFSDMLGEEIPFWNIKNPNDRYKVIVEDGMIINQPGNTNTI